MPPQVQVSTTAYPIAVSVRLNLLRFEQSNTHSQREQEFSVLKQGTADVFIDDHSEVVVEIPDSLLKLFRRLTLVNGLQQKAGSVYYTIIL